MLDQLLTRKDLVDKIIGRLMSGEKNLSYSSLSAFKKSPTAFIDYQLGIKEETDAMIYGSMVHCLVLEPDDFENRYFCLDDTVVCLNIGGAKPRATKAYKEWYAIEAAGAGDKIIVGTEDYRIARMTAKNVRENKASAKVLKLCPEREKKVEWEYMNFSFKGFKDADGEKDTFDLKTCTDADPEKFQREIINRGYYLQAAMYLQAEGPRNYYIIAVDKKGGISVHLLHPKLVEYGLNEYHKLLTRFNECILRNTFHENYDFWSPRWDGIFMMERPAYLYKYE